MALSPFTLPSHCSTSANKTKQVVTLLTRELITHPSDDVRVVIVRLYEDIVRFPSLPPLSLLLSEDSH